MKSNCFLLLLFLGLASTHRHPIHKICVPETTLVACQQMVEQAKQRDIHMECLPARDRVECVEKVGKDEAALQAVDPNEMYLAAQRDDSAYTVFEEIRTKEEPRAEFRYEAVAVIPKSLEIKDIKSLKGLNSCHTGVGRNVGYKIPITKLTKMGVLGPLSDTSLSPRENELKALSQFFSKACLVGTWSPHPETNKRLKEKYSNLCALCEHPDKCDYPDQNSGYEGALRCLATAGGQVAWTKVIFVKKFFGVPYGSEPAKESQYKPDDYAYLCPDGSRRPITGPPCTWAARPWSGYIASSHLDAEDVQALRKEIAELNNLGESTHADWIAKVLLLNNKTIPVENTPISPLKYLEKAKYKDVIERDVLEPRRLVRVCTQTQTEMEKCEVMKKAAYSRDIRPSLACVRSENCTLALLEKKAEVVVLDTNRAIEAESQGLKPLLEETYGNVGLTAVVKKGSTSVTELVDMKGKKICIPNNNTPVTYSVIRYLAERDQLKDLACPMLDSLKRYFASVIFTSEPLQCTETGEGDVAVVPVAALPIHGGNGNLELLCEFKNQGFQNVPKECIFDTVYPRMVMVSNNLAEVQIDEVRQTLLSAANLYGKEPELFRMFGRFNNETNVIFSDYASGLETVPERGYYKMHKHSISDGPPCYVF